MTPETTTASTGGIRILLADDQALVRGALATLLGLEDDLDVIAQVGRGDEVLPAAEQHRPDIALLDVEMPGVDGLTAAAQLRRALPGVRIVIVTTFGRAGYLSRALAAGVAGYVVKDTPASELADVVRRVMKGETVIDAALATDALTAGPSPLTPRETEVLAAARDGGTISDVARALHLSEGTTRNHLSSAMQKLEARTRADAARIAQERGWLL
ncbi:response regulator transcription factor [Microbacterium azadirachtae]|uniref:response regulator transcription factor n=1 Tax=Microbacterium azadirachtae TaxID=582680 RepID=UPI0021D4DF4C|nr:response regulator transcription factor [Microbacterium azadirachtae]UXW86348.1 response regulator transcription factor [Microbacterium azadirachtae]